MQISIVIVTIQEREKLLDQMLQSLTNALTKVQLSAEIIIVQNDNSSLKREGPYIILNSNKLTPGAARNLGIQKANGDWLLFLDDDIILPSDYFLSAKNFFDVNNPDIFGGPDLPLLPQNQVAAAFGLVLNNPLVMGPTIFRHTNKLSFFKPSGDEWNLILCHMWIRREITKQYSDLFDPQFFRNEENQLLTKLKREGYQIEYLPSLFVFHKRKDSLKKIGSALYSSGKNRMLMFYNRSIQPLYLLTPLTAILILISLKFKLIFFITNSIIYIALNRRISPRDFLLAHIITLIVIFSYTAGMAETVVKELLKKTPFYAARRRA